MKPRNLVHESLTEDQAFWLGQLVEEASEVIHRAMKCLLYGLKDNHPIVGKPNDSALAYEIGNFDEVVRRFEKAGICLDDSMLGMDEKMNNLKKYHGR